MILHLVEIALLVFIAYGVYSANVLLKRIHQELQSNNRIQVR